MIFPILTENEKKFPFYLMGVGCEYDQEHVNRPQGYPNFQWIQCYEGEGEVILNNKKQRLGVMQGLFLLPDVEHEYYPVQDNWKVDWITFDGYGVLDFLNIIGINTSEILSVTNSDLIIGRLRRIEYIAKSQNSLKGIESSELVYGLLTDLQKYTSKFNEESIVKKHSKLKPVLKYIDENYNKWITLEQLADTINVTPEYLCLLFKEIMNIRPFEYINSIRISKSKDLLIKHKELNVSSIGMQVGYEDASYFCASFKKIEGITPGKFKMLY
jgi:AraC family transcriptional regulator of arabinose operon